MPRGPAAAAVRSRRSGCTDFGLCPVGLVLQVVGQRIAPATFFVFGSSGCSHEYSTHDDESAASLLELPRARRWDTFLRGLRQGPAAASAERLFRDAGIAA